MDLHSLQAITVHCVPAHHLKETLCKNLAGDLTALSLVCLHNAPAYRITGTDVTGTDNQFLFCGIDQKLMEIKPVRIPLSMIRIGINACMAQILRDTLIYLKTGHGSIDPTTEMTYEFYKQYKEENEHDI